MEKMLVIDGNSILNRQYYGVRPLCTKEGIYTNAVFGFTKVLLSLIDRLAPDAMAVAFDRKEPTFRHKLYDAYKAGRHATPEELLMQFPYAERLVKALGASVLSLPGYEADDILGTLSRRSEEAGMTCFLVTGDKDALQLITDRTTVLLAGNAETVSYTPEVFYEKYGVTPAQFVDVKALMGDASDNIPGVSGIGEKTALKLIAQKGSLEALYADLPGLHLTPALQKRLETGQDSAFFSQTLARIDCAAPLEATLESLARRPYDFDALRALFRELEFTAFHKIFREEPTASAGSAPAAPTALPSTVPQSATPQSTVLQLGDLSSRTFSAPLALFETETGLSLADAAGAYFLEGVTLASFFDAWPAARRVPVAVYDSKALFYALPAASALSVEVADDFSLAAYVLDAAGSFSPERLVTVYLNEELDREAPAAQMLRLRQTLEERLVREDTLKLYRTVELPLARVLFAMEQRGFLVDKEMLADFSEKLESAAAIAMQEIYHLAGKSFNINSPKQLGEVLFEDLKLPVFKKNKSHGYSTDAEVLEKLRPFSPIIDLITSYRQSVKFKATYADALCRAADEDGRVHTRFHQTVTATGRLSSAEPNLQNIPVRTELGREFRRAFAAREGCLLVDADYSQIELRIVAALSGDETMIRAFREGVDIHAVTASQIFGLPVENVTSELRKRAKAVNFGIVYGIGGYSLSQDIGISKKEADEYIAGYKATYPKVDAFLKNQIKLAKEQGYVTTLFGRRRYIPELTSQRASLRSFGERVAMNSPIQGTAADIIKFAMIAVEKALAEEGFAARMILQVHDELIIEAPEAEAPRVAELLRACMENAASLAVPLTVDVSVGKTWYDCK